MTEYTPSRQTGDFAPDCVLPDGTTLSARRGQPVVLAFAPNEWNPAHAYQSAVFARLTREFGGCAAFLDTAADGWHALDSRGELAAQFGVTGQRALLVLDEAGILRWKIVEGSNHAIQTGQVLAALEALRPVAAPRPAEGMSRRTFVTATLAAAALLVLLPGESTAGDSAAPATESPLPTAPPDLVPVTVSLTRCSWNSGWCSMRCAKPCT